MIINIKKGIDSLLSKIFGNNPMNEWSTYPKGKWKIFPYIYIATHLFNTQVQGFTNKGLKNDTKRSINIIRSLGGDTKQITINNDNIVKNQGSSILKIIVPEILDEYMLLDILDTHKETLEIYAKSFDKSIDKNIPNIKFFILQESNIVKNPINVIEYKHNSYNLYTNSKEYRLGDMLINLPQRSKKGGKSYHKKRFPNSIATKYLEKTDDVGNYHILKEIVQELFIPDKNINKNTDCLLHLRVGDTIDGLCPKNYFFEKFFKNNNTHTKKEDIICDYIKPIEYFQECILILLEIGITKVYIMAGAHVKMSSYKYSSFYINSVKKTIREKWY